MIDKMGKTRKISTQKDHIKLDTRGILRQQPANAGEYTGSKSRSVLLECRHSPSLNPIKDAALGQPKLDP